MDRTAVLEIIRNGFTDIEIERIFIVHDPLIGGEVAQVVLREDQLEDALRGNGVPARRAAMESGLDVEVVLTTDPEADD